MPYLTVVDVTLRDRLHSCTGNAYVNSCRHRDVIFILTKFLIISKKVILFSFDRVLNNFRMAYDVVEGGVRTPCYFREVTFDVRSSYISE